VLHGCSTPFHELDIAKNQNHIGDMDGVNRLKKRFNHASTKTNARRYDSVEALTKKKPEATWVTSGSSSGHTDRDRRQTPQQRVTGHPGA
jgi:hypothetical protein